MRHIMDDHETIQEAERITSQTTANGERILICDGLHLSSGVAYVMNEAGRTVAKYELGPPLSTIRAAQDLAEKFPDGKIREGGVR